YRRSTHRNEPDYGRQISAIAIKEDSHGPAF
ncbi:MAG: polyphenol oxidase, partial [Roseibium sp.]